MTKSFWKILIFINTILIIFILYINFEQSSEIEEIKLHYSSINKLLSENLLNVTQRLDESNEKYEQLHLRMNELENRVSGIQAIGSSNDSVGLFKSTRQGEDDVARNSNTDEDNVKYIKACSGSKTAPFVYLGLGLAGLILQQQCSN